MDTEKKPIECKPNYAELQARLESLHDVDIMHILYTYVNPGVPCRDDLIEAVLKACTEDDKLYDEVFSEVATLIGQGASDVIDNSERED